MYKSLLISTLLALSLFLSACGGGTTVPTTTPIPVPVPDGSGCKVTSPPKDKDNKSIYDSFYTKYCSANGVAILASNNVSDLALQQAWYIVMNMAAKKPGVLKTLADGKILIGVIGTNEVTTDMPEYKSLGSSWDQTRGLGATEYRPLSSGAEENLLCLEKDVYRGENIFVHEFAHTFLNLGIGKTDTEFVDRVKAAYEAAIKSGLYKNTYAAKDYEEYWAEGAQSYFNANLEATPPNGIHNEINTRAELKEYDLDLYNLLAEVFPDYDWTPKCPTLPATATPVASSTPNPTSTIDITPNTMIIYISGNTSELTSCTGTEFSAQVTDPNGVSRVFVQFFVSAGDLTPGSFSTPSGELELTNSGGNMWSGTFNDTISQIQQITYWQFVVIDSMGNRTELYEEGKFSFYARNQSCP